MLKASRSNIHRKTLINLDNLEFLFYSSIWNSNKQVFLLFFFKSLVTFTYVRRKVW